MFDAEMKGSRCDLFMNWRFSIIMDITEIGQTGLQTLQSIKFPQQEDKASH
jgi:hypothetical protein